MTPPDPITLADEAEERSAAEALRAARNTRDLSVIWTRDCDGFKGEARNRLLDLYRYRLRALGVFQP